MFTVDHEAMIKSSHASVTGSEAFIVVYLEPWQTSKLECSVKIVNSFQALTIFEKHSILDVWHHSE